MPRCLIRYALLIVTSAPRAGCLRARYWSVSGLYFRLASGCCGAGHSEELLRGCPKSGWFHVEHARKSAWWWLELRRTRCPLPLSFIVDMQEVPLSLTPRNNHVAGGKPIDLLCVTQSNTRKAAVQASHSIHHTIGCACQYVPVISRVIDCGKDLEDPVPNGFLCCC